MTEALKIVIRPHTHVHVHVDRTLHNTIQSVFVVGGGLPGIIFAKTPSYTGTIIIHIGTCKSSIILW